MIVVDAHFDASVFEPTNLAQAQEIILSYEVDRPTNVRWQTETPHLINVIDQHCPLNEHTIALDFGCGVGRMSLAMIEKYDCRVMGEDISHSMLSMSEDYVRSDRFLAVNPEWFSDFPRWGIRVDFAIAIWVLQHVWVPKDEIDRIYAAMKPGAKFFVVNEIGRRVPTKEAGWGEDRIDIHSLLLERFMLVKEGKLDPEIVTPAVSERTYWAIFQKTPLNGSL